MKKGIRFLIGASAMAFAFISFSLTAAAQESDVFELGEIIVTGAQEKAPVINTTTEVTAADIEKSGATSVGAALSGLSGVWTTTGGKNVMNVEIRGMLQGKVLVLLDGVPMTSPYDGYLDLNQIPVDNVSKITVVKGIASPLYGSDAMGGVINIITKKQSGKAAGKLKVGLDEVGSYNEAISYYLPIGGRSLTISASGSKSDGFKMSGNFIPTNLATEDGGRRLNSEFEKNNIGLKYGHEGTNPFYINFNYTKNNMGMMVNTTSNPITGTLTRKLSSFSRFTDWKSWTTDVSREQNFSDTFKIRAKVYYHKFGNTVTQYTNNTFSTIANQSGTPFISAYDDYDAGMRLLSDWAITKNHQLNFSLNVVEDQHKKQPSPSLPWDEYVTRTISLGAESNVKLSERLAFVTGASYDRLTPKSSSYYSYNTAGAVVATGPLTKAGGDTNSAINPMFGINITPDEKNSLHVTFGRKTRFPTQSELYGSNNGNPDLKPQKSNSFETGYEYKYDCGYALNLTAFSNRVSGLIYSPSSTIQLTNMSRASFKGYEIGLKKTTGKLTGSLMRTYVSARDRDNKIFLTNIPLRKTDFDLAYNFYKSMVFDLSSIYASPRYTSATNMLPSYTVINAGLSGELKSLNTKWHLYVNNVNDRNYMQEDGYPQAGRTVRGMLEYNF